MWRCTGLRWRDGRAHWTWCADAPAGRSTAADGGRLSPVRLGDPVSLAVAPDAVRRCVGVWRGGLRTPCPYEAALRDEARRDQCEPCAALDRTSSVAADTRADDPQPYAVYLAWFGPGRHKVGITAAARGNARLLEQAAVCFAFLGEGPLMTARRTEAVLGVTLGIPDRVTAAAKRAARPVLPAAGERAAELRVLHDRVLALRDRLPESLRLRPFEPVDHAALFGLAPAPPRPAAEITALPPGCALTGTVRAVAGHDLYLDTAGGCLLLDTRLTAGWELRRAPDATPDATCDVPTRPLPVPADQPQPLF